ncbi:MAG: DUF1016 N-terminal domain-containing protein [Oscillibacter sp.]|nr:DUF1016 N-terminal domain-containing protein [Oscillibacter sp.]
MKLSDLTSAISQTHIALQSNVVKAINRNLTLRNWLIGFCIVEFEQKGEDRAQYGTNLLKTLEKQINTRGLTETLFKLSRQFYITYPEIGNIITNQLNTISTTLSQEFIQSLSSVTFSNRSSLSPNTGSPLNTAALQFRPTLSDELQNTDNQKNYTQSRKINRQPFFFPHSRTSPHRKSPQAPLLRNRSHQMQLERP